MSRQSGGSSGVGCALFALLLIIGAVVAAGISLAAVVDPFSWMPPLAEIWEECEDDRGTGRDECDLAARFDGFWVHALVNVVYALVTAVMLLALAGCVGDLREARRARFSGGGAPQRYAEARRAMIGTAMVLGVLAAIPIAVAL